MDVERDQREKVRRIDMIEKRKLRAQSRRGLTSVGKKHRHETAKWEAQEWREGEIYRVSERKHEQQGNKFKK